MTEPKHVYLVLDKNERFLGWTYEYEDIPVKTALFNSHGCFDGRPAFIVKVGSMEKEEV